MVPDGDAHILLTVEARLVAAVASQDIMMLQHIENDFIGCSGRQDLTEEKVGLRGHHPKETDASQLLFKVGPFL